MQKLKLNHEIRSDSPGSNPMHKLLARLSQQQAAINQQHNALRSSDETNSYSPVDDYVSVLSSTPITPDLTEPYNGINANGSSDGGCEDRFVPNIEELTRLKFELEAAKSKIARMDQELAQTRITRHTLDQVIGSTSEVDSHICNSQVNNFKDFPNSYNGALSKPENFWAIHDDNRSDCSDPISTNGFNRSRNIWSNVTRPAFNSVQPIAQTFQQPSANIDQAQFMSRNFGQPFIESSLNFTGGQFNEPRSEQLIKDPEVMVNTSINQRTQINGRLNNHDNGLIQYARSKCSLDGYHGSPVSNISGNNLGLTNGANSNSASGLRIHSNYQPQPIGTRLSPHAPEFTSSSNWKGDVNNNFLDFFPSRSC